MQSGLKITTFNVNGIRSFEKYIKSKYNKSLNGFFLEILSSDIICLQETKTNLITEYLSLKDYNSFFSINKGKQGYCGVCTFVRKTIYAKKVETDNEGRYILTDHQTFKVLNVYFPYFDEGNYKKDLEIKKKEVKMFYEKIEALIYNYDDAIVLGDFNATYDFKDHYQYIKEVVRINKINNKSIKPIKKENFLKTELPYSFFNEEDLTEYFFSVYQRKWLFNLLSKNILYDSFRRINPNVLNKYTCWNTLLNLRSKNLGTRIDLILVPVSMNTLYSEILNNVFGSDHCPVTTIVEINCIHNEEKFCKNNLLHFLKKNDK